jgi:hypothetical protein
MTMMLADLWHGTNAASTRHLALSVLLATALPLAVCEAPEAYSLRAEVRGLPHTDQQMAFDYLKQHPGKAYFPWFPLAHFYAEGQFRHFIWGLVDRSLAGETVSMTEFRAYIPPDPQVIFFAKDGPQVYEFNLMKYLPEYSRAAEDPELHGWTDYAKAPQ